MRDESTRLPIHSPDDQRLFDLLAERQFDPSLLDLSEEDQARADAILRLLGLLDDYPVDDPDPALVDATLARIGQHERDRESRLTMETQHGREWRRIRLPDFITVAAVILIGASIGLPILHQMRQRSIDVRCANNMRLLAYAFGNYAADYGGEVPIARAGMPSAWNRNWRHVLNLAPLVEGDYCQRDHLDCPGHEGQVGESYSYQWHSSEFRPRWGRERATLILGDRNPLIDAMDRGILVSPAILSSNHGGRGQNVLVSDGSGMWLETAVIGRDNIWLPKGVQRLQNGVQITDAEDVFLTD